MQTLRGRLIIGMTIVLIAVAFVSWLPWNPESRTVTVPSDAMYIFQGVKGPDSVTTVCKRPVPPLGLSRLRGRVRA